MKIKKIIKRIGKSRDKKGNMRIEYAIKIITEVLDKEAVSVDNILEPDFLEATTILGDTICREHDLSINDELSPSVFEAVLRENKSDSKCILFVRVQETLCKLSIDVYNKKASQVS